VVETIKGQQRSARVCVEGGGPHVAGQHSLDAFLSYLIKKGESDMFAVLKEVTVLRRKCPDPLLPHLLPLFRI
jgi:hypothetical protein